MTARTVIHVGDALAVLKTLPSESVQCIVTSPPYYGLRDYGKSDQLGLEPTPDEYVARLVAVFAEARRVLRDDGVLWLNLGDSYATQRNDHVGGGFGDNSVNKHSTIAKRGRFVPDGYKMKDLLGIPWRVAFALQADGWWLRSDCIWHKPNPMPESVTDRPTKSHEYVFLLSKSARYFYDAEAVKEDSLDPASYEPRSPRNPDKRDGNPFFATKVGDHANGKIYPTRNKRTVWTITTTPYSGAHFATMPPDLVEVCVKAGTSERGCCPECGAAWERVVEKTGRVAAGHGVTKVIDEMHNIYPMRQNGTRHGNTSSLTTGEKWATTTAGWRPTCDHEADPVPCAVLDPFGGAGTTGLVANRLDRDAVLIELNADYAEMARERIYGDAPMFANVEVV